MSKGLISCFFADFALKQEILLFKCEKIVLQPKKKSDLCENLFKSLIFAR